MNGIDLVYAQMSS